MKEKEQGRNRFVGFHCNHKFKVIEKIPIKQRNIFTLFIEREYTSYHLQCIHCGVVEDQILRGNIFKKGDIIGVLK